MSAQTPASNPYLLIQQITDQYIRTNFQNIKNYFDTQNQFLDFKFFELSYSAAQTDVLVAHGLPYIPLDILCSKITGTGAVTFKFGSFTADNMVLDVSGPCRIRFYAGTYSKFSTAINATDSDTQTFQSSVADTLASSKITYSMQALPFTGTLSGAKNNPILYYVRLTDDVLYIDCTSANQTVVLPDATTCKGSEFTIYKVDQTTNTCAINTTSSQTIGLRASGDIKLYSWNDLLTVVSTGTTWVIKNKRETQMLLSAGNGSYGASLSAIWLSGGASLALTPGTWRIVGYTYAASSVGTAGQFYVVQGQFSQATGTGTGTAPTAIAASNAIALGGVTGSEGSVQGVTNGTGGGAVVNLVGPFILLVKQNFTLWLNLLMTTPAGATGSWVAQVTAERVW